MRKGGGTAIYVREGINFKEVCVRQLLNQCAEGTLIELPDLNLTILCLYIPPNIPVSTLDMLEDDICALFDYELGSVANRRLIILGDFNQFDVKRLESALSLTDIVNRPTRGNNILDHALISENLISCYDSSKVSFNPPVGKSDHLTLLITPDYCLPQYEDRRKIKVFDFRKSNIENLVQDAATISWQVNALDEVDDQWANLKRKVTELMHNNIPQKTVIISSRDKIWMTPLTKLIINEKWKAYREQNWRLFNHLKRKTKVEIMKAKTLWAQKIKRSTNGLWKLARHLSGKEIKAELHNLLSEFRSPVRLAEKIATMITEDSDNQLPVLSNFQQEYLSKAFYDKSTCHEDHLPPPKAWCPNISEKEIEGYLRKLDSNKAMGVDQIPNKVYRILSPFLSIPLKTIFETSVNKQVFPTEWKKAIIVPIPKTNPPSIKKLRTISLLPSPAKILEKLILERLRQSFETIVGPNQHAFRKQASTTTALVQLFDIITEFFDDLSNTGFGIINLDFSKAFDRVDHSVLLSKLSSARLPTEFVKWTANYLFGRTYQVKIQGQLSGIHELTCGVPQGSVLGPALFSILVSDLPQVRSSTSLVQYADDASFLLPFKTRNPQDIKCEVEQLLSCVNKWCTDNKQLLNFEKSTFLLHMRTPLQIENLPIPLVETQKSLGVLLNSKLTWDCHITYICKKACKRLHLLRMMKTQVREDELHSLYLSTIRSLFDYCCPVFVTLPKKLIQKIRRVERRAHRIIYGDNFLCDCYGDGFQERRNNISLKLLNTIIRNQKHLLHYKLPNKSRYRHKLQNFTCRTNRRLHSFFPHATLLYNSMHNRFTL